MLARHRPEGLIGVLEEHWVFPEHGPVEGTAQRSGVSEGAWVSRKDLSADVEVVCQPYPRSVPGVGFGRGARVAGCGYRVAEVQVQDGRRLECRGVDDVARSFLDEPDGLCSGRKRLVGGRRAP